MKQFKSILIFVLVALAGCTKTEFVYMEKEITFTVGKYATETKAASIIDVDNIRSFNTKAWLYAEGVDGAQDFFGTGETITYNNTDAWEPSHPYYWPKSSNSYINFVSWYDKNGAPTLISEEALEWSGRTIVADDNIMFADAAWHYNQNPSANYHFNGVVSGVPTLFHHALARVQVNLKASVDTNPDNNTETYEVSLQSASLEGIYRRGNMKLVNSESSTTGTSAWRSNNSPTFLWTTSSGSNSESFTLVSSNTAITTTNYAVMSLSSFLPQNLGDAVILHFTYTITTRSNGSIVSSENGITANVTLNTIKNSSDEEIDKWLPNRRYIYNFTINPVGQDILLNPVVESDWSFNPDLTTTVE